MNAIKLINELRTERQNIDEAISVLSRLATNGPKRRGRPPKWMGSSRNTPIPVGEDGQGVARHMLKRKPFSAETRKRMSAAQKKRWAS